MFSTLLLIIAVYFIKGATIVPIKMGMSYYPPALSAAFRFLLAGILIFAYVWIRHGRKVFSIPRKDLLHIMLNGLYSGGAIMAYYIAIYLNSASRTAILANTVPFFVAIIAAIVLREDSFTPRKIIGLIIGFTGATILTVGGRGIGSASLAGDIAALVCALLWAYGLVDQKRIIKVAPTEIQMAWKSIPIVLLIIIYSLIFERRTDIIVNPESIGIMAVLVLFCTCFAYIGQLKVIEKFDISTIGSFNFAIPLVGVISSMIILREQASGQIGLSLVLVSTGIFMVGYRRGILSGSVVKNGLNNAYRRITGG
jgi:drug/metabolite transporter (DMT)-like permease